MNTTKKSDIGFGYHRKHCGGKTGKCLFSHVFVLVDREESELHGRGLSLNETYQFEQQLSLDSRIINMGKDPGTWFFTSSRGHQTSSNHGFSEKGLNILSQNKKVPIVNFYPDT